MTSSIETHLPCSCPDYDKTFHGGEIYCPARGAMSAQCAECNGCKLCRLVVSEGGTEWYWHYRPQRDNRPNGRKELAKALLAIIMRCHATAVSKGFWAEDESIDNLEPGALPPKDKVRHFAESMMWATREISEAFDAWQKGDDERIAEEMADAIIILFDAAEGRGIDIVSAMFDKMERNVQRPMRHGGKRT